MNAATIHIPISATFRVIDGEAVMIEAEYADVPAESIAQLLVQSYGFPISDERSVPHE